MTDATGTGPVQTPVRQADVFAWRMERDPLLRSTITAVVVLDRAPDRTVLYDRVERATRLAPMFRERLVRAPLPLPLSTPTWALDPDLDLSWHVRWVALPEASLDALFDLARIEGMTAFDPARPLWEITVVEGLPDGRAAMILKVHHSLTDGIGGIQLAEHVVDLEREPADRGPLPALPTEGPRATGTERVRAALVHDVATVGRAVVGGLGRLPAGLRRAVSDPVGTALGAARTTISIARFVAPITDTLSPVMTERRLVWRYAALDVPFDDLRAAAHAVSGTLNDAFVTAVTGGLRRYHERHEARVEQVRMTMPVSVRAEDDPAGGNRITLLRFPVPVEEPDPVARMIAIDRLTAGLRREPAIAYSEVIAGVLNLLPAAITGSMLKHVDVLASNVPGFPVPVYVAGARVEGFYPCGPTIGSSANITLMSYAGTCCVGVTTDAGAVPDPDVFVDCLCEGFDEVLALVPTGRTATVRARSWAAIPEPLSSLTSPS